MERHTHTHTHTQPSGSGVIDTTCVWCVAMRPGLQCQRWRVCLRNLLLRLHLVQWLRLRRVSARHSVPRHGLSTMPRVRSGQLHAARRTQPMYSLLARLLQQPHRNGLVLPLRPRLLLPSGKEKNKRKSRKKDIKETLIILST